MSEESGKWTFFFDKTFIAEKISSADSERSEE
jgi:hypothetical protein